MAVLKVIEILANSPKGFEDAAKNAVKEGFQKRKKHSILLYQGADLFSGKW